MNGLLQRLLPRQFDNRFRGHWLALWVFGLVVALNIGIDLVSILRPDGGAQSADGIPLDTFPPAAAQAVIGVGALLGLADLFLAVMFVLALVRYRAMIPLMYLLIVTQFFAHKAVLFLKPIVRMPGTSHGTYVTWGLFAVSVLGLILSLVGRGYRPQAAQASGPAPLPRAGASR